MNVQAFLAGQNKYFKSSYAEFERFGGPCVYFHQECVRAAAEAFLSVRHIETLYATLAAWGMHRMGDASKTKTKLASWSRFYSSIAENAEQLKEFRNLQLLELPESAYVEVVDRLRPVYQTLDLTESKATVVVNSKALHHLLPQLIPPIDRQYTIRFFRQPSTEWKNSSNKYKLISLPSGREAQFRLFRETCIELKRLADRVDPSLFEEQLQDHGVPAPKALDNAIVSYVRSVVVPLPTH